MRDSYSSPLEIEIRHARIFKRVVVPTPQEFFLFQPQGGYAPLIKYGGGRAACSLCLSFLIFILTVVGLPNGAWCSLRQWGVILGSCSASFLRVGRQECGLGSLRPFLTLSMGNVGGGHTGSDLRALPVSLGGPVTLLLCRRLVSSKTRFGWSRSHVYHLWCCG